MIKFIDIKNGQVFNGSSYIKQSVCPKCGFTKDIEYYDTPLSSCPCGYKLQHTLTGPHHIFWFDGGQSTDMYNFKEICILTDNKHGQIHPISKKNILQVSINDNDIFKLVNIGNLTINEDIVHDEVINGFNYVDIENLINSNNVLIEGEKYGDYYIHMLYIMAKSNISGEFTTDIFIDGVPYTIGADFYDENESLFINLSNLGFDISSDVQKAIYPANVHEDYVDNILINRKLKELLINFWDIIANKGSHKSLLNSLKWFEWGDIATIKEIWQHNIGNKTILSHNDFQSVLTESYKEYLSHFAKSTYVGLYAALEYIKKDNGFVVYDSEKNPELEFISSKWSFNDLSLKMSVLGKFYEMFFMPIHLDLIHSTIEDIVFLNTIKIHNAISICREDSVYNFGNIIHNVDNTTYYMSTITPPVPNSTTTAILWDDLTYDIIEDTGEDGSSYYNGAGVSIPVNMKLPVSEGGEFVKSVIISLKTGLDNAGKDIWNTYTIYKHFKNKVDSDININFNIICCKEYAYDIRFQFNLTNSHVYTTRLNFNTSNIDTIGMVLYKYKRKVDLKPQDFGAVYIDIDHIEDDYRLKRDSDRYTGDMQYVQIPETTEIGMNHIIVLEGDYTKNQDNFFEYYYTILYKNDDKEYTVCISKEFNFEPKEIPQFLLEVMYSNGYKYMAEFYDMTELTGNTIDDFTINENESLCISVDLKFGYYIKNHEWIFKNLSNGETYYPQVDIYSPFVTYGNTSELPTGFYDIIFTYELYDGTFKEFKLNSAFYKK